MKVLKIYSANKPELSKSITLLIFFFTFLMAWFKMFQWTDLMTTNSDFIFMSIILMVWGWFVLLSLFGILYFLHLRFELEYIKEGKKRK